MGAMAVKCGTQPAMFRSKSCRGRREIYRTRQTVAYPDREMRPL
jgi:hypothetical protein